MWICGEWNLPAVDLERWVGQGAAQFEFESEGQAECRGAWHFIRRFHPTPFNIPSVFESFSEADYAGATTTKESGYIVRGIFVLGRYVRAALLVVTYCHDALLAVKGVSL